MKFQFFSKNNMISLLLWVAFGFTSFSAGARFSVNGIAYIGMFAIVLTMVLREYSQGLREGSEIASSIWKAKMDELFESLRKV